MVGANRVMNARGDVNHGYVCFWNKKMLEELTWEGVQVKAAVVPGSHATPLEGG